MRVVFFVVLIKINLCDIFINFHLPKHEMIPKVFKKNRSKFEIEENIRF